MRDEQKTKAQLIEELNALRRRVVKLEAEQRPAVVEPEPSLTGDHQQREQLEELIAARTAEWMIAHEKLLHEIVEREWAEEALRKIKSRYELAVRAGKVVIWDWDPWTNEFYVDPILQTILGYEVQESQNGLHDWFRSVHPDDIERVRATVEAHLAGGAESFELEHRMLHRDGSIRWFVLRGSSLRDENHKPYRLIGTNTDITEYKQAEETIRRAHLDLSKKAADLEAANKELGQYAYVVSHDLKAPLRAIHNYADFLKEDLQVTLSGEQAEYLAGLLEAVNEAETLVNDLLELSRIGRKNVPTELIDLGHFLQDLLDSLEIPASAEVHLAEQWPTLEAQPPLLRQIFQNLVQNGLTFNQSPAKRVELGWRLIASNCYEFFVRDNGIGIKSEYQEQIFNVFQRLHTNEEYPGTGIGLAIVKKAAEKLQGSVRVESTEGQGSTFYVILPKFQEGDKA